MNKLHRARPAAIITRMRNTIFVLIAVLAAQTSAAAWPGKILSPLWTLQAANGKDRWLEIHDLKGLHVDGLYHVQVLERNRSDAPTSSTSIADHMAITEAALRASILAPRNTGSVNPGRFNSGYSAWQAARAAGQGFVCDTSVTACLASAVN